MTQKAYEVLLDQLAAELGIDKIETDDMGGFVLELDESRWVSVAYSAAEDKLICQLCLEPVARTLEVSDLRYLLRQNDLSHSSQQQHFALLQSEQQQEHIVVLLLRLAVHDATPHIFLQAIERMLHQGLGVETYLLSRAKSEPDSLPVSQMAIKA